MSDSEKMAKRFMPQEDVALTKKYCNIKKELKSDLSRSKKDQMRIYQRKNDIILLRMNVDKSSVIPKC